MYFAWKLVHLIVRASNKLAVRPGFNRTSFMQDVN